MITIENIKDTLEEININNNLIGKMAHFEIDYHNNGANVTIAVWMYSDEFDKYYRLIDIEYYTDEIWIVPHGLDMQLGSISILDFLCCMDDEMLEYDLEKYQTLLHLLVDNSHHIKTDELWDKIKKSNIDDKLFREFCMYTLDEIKEVFFSMIESLQNIYHDLLGKY